MALARRASETSEVHIGDTKRRRVAVLEAQITDCKAAAETLSRVAERPPIPILAGFDGFVDNIISVVDSRTSRTEYTSVPSLASFGARIQAAAGESANVELVTQVSKIGGNGPNMCNAMVGFNVELTYIGPLGKGKPDPVFAPLVQRTKEVITLGPPACTDALEFKDGKLMMGKLQPLEAVTYDSLVAAVGLERLRKLCCQSAALVCVNWTMIMSTTEIWQGLIKEILPALAEQGKRPIFFVDICDPKKRPQEDLRACLETLTRVQKYCNVVFSINCSETRQCLAVFGENWKGTNEDTESACCAASLLQRKLGIYCVQVHLKASAACATASECVGVPGYYTAEPVITTGAGDHFNSGFLMAMLNECSLSDCLRIGGAVSGNYVRGVSSRGSVSVGTSPTCEDTLRFLNELPKIDPTPSSL